MTKVMNINKEESNTVSMAEVDSNTESPITSKTLVELKEERTTIEKEIENDMTDIKNAMYEVDFVKDSNINNLSKLIDKGLEWTIKEAALHVNLYENLKSEKARLKDETSKLVRLSNIDLNTLYTSLTSLKGCGIEKAKSFLRLLTEIGNNISEQMNKMASNNQVVQEKNQKLTELDSVITSMENPPIEADEITEENA